MAIDDALNSIGKEEELKKEKALRKKLEAALKKKEAEAAKAKAQLESENVEVKKLLSEYHKRLEDHVASSNDNIIRAHLRSLSNFWPGEPKDEIDQIVVKLVSHPDFVDIYKTLLVLDNHIHKIEYLFRQTNEKNICGQGIDQKALFERLAPLGLNLICPYFKNNNLQSENNANNHCFDACLIEEEPIHAGCDGRHDICEAFKKTTVKFALGEVDYVKPKCVYKPPVLNMSHTEKSAIKQKVIDENEKYWRDDE